MTQRILVLCLLAQAGWAQAPALQYAPIANLKLDSGETLAECRVAYRAYGKLNADKSNVVLFPTWFTGRSSDLDGHVRAWFDLERHYVVTVDAIGNGVSCSPSQRGVKRMTFPKFTIADMVRSQQRLVTETIGAKRLFAVVGISMGGMQTFEWVTAYPEMVERAVPIVGTTAQTTSDLLLWTAQARAIALHKDFGGGAYKTAPDLTAVTAMHQFALTSPAWLARQNAGEFGPMLSKASAGMRMDAVDYLRQLEAMMGHDVGRGRGGAAGAARLVKAKMLVVVASQDHMVNPAPASEFARLTGSATVVLQGDCGHLAPGCESATLNEAVKRFLAR